MIIKNFKNSRENIDIKQKDIAEFFNLNFTTISGWETGKDTIPLRRLIEYANHYNFSLDYLFGITNKNDESYLPLEIDIDLISKTPQGTKIICLNDMKVFDTIKEASIYYQCDSSAISKVCKGIWSNTHKLRFMYYNEYLKQLEDNIPITTPKTRVKKVICLETNKKYETIRKLVGFGR